MRRVFSLFAFCGLAVSGASAFDVGNCSYEIISEAEKNCRLTHVSADTGWSLTVPASVSYGYTSYTVTEIGENAMADCKGTLTSLSLASSSVPLHFAHNALSGARLDNLAMGRDFTSAVNDEPFEGMKSLSQLTVGYGVTRIPNFAFHGCSFTTVTLPSTVNSIGVAAFDNCALTTITFESGSKLESIGYEAFNGSKLNTITLPASLKYIGSEAFAATAIKTLRIPAKVEQIGVNAFAGCSVLNSLTIDPANPHFAAENNMIYSGGYHTLLQGGAARGYVTVNSATKKIGEYAFNGSRVSEVKLPAGLESIGEYAFMRCDDLTTIELPAGVTELGRGAFAYCRSMSSITLPSMYRIPDELLMCTGLMAVEFAGAVTKIGKQAFSTCTKLTGIELPATVNEIESGAFEQCTALTSMTFPQDVMLAIGDQAFRDCNKLADVKFPNWLVTVGENAFSGCSAITEVKFYGMLERIGAGAFAGINMTTVSCDGPVPPEIDVTTFSNKTYSKAQLLVPPGTLDTYKGTPGWKFFSSAVESVELGGVDEVEADARGPVTIYTPAGRLVYQGDRALMPCLTPGIYIINGTKIILR